MNRAELVELLTGQANRPVSLQLPDGARFVVDLDDGVYEYDGEIVVAIKPEEN